MKQETRKSILLRRHVMPLEIEIVCDTNTTPRNFFVLADELGRAMKEWVERTSYDKEHDVPKRLKVSVTYD